MQLGGRLQVPVCVRRVPMAEIRAQERQLAVDLDAGVMPVQQRGHGKSMSEIVRARACTMTASFQAGRADHLREDIVGGGDGEPHAEPGEEQRVGVRLRPVAGRAARHRRGALRWWWCAAGALAACRACRGQAALRDRHRCRRDRGGVLRRAAGRSRPSIRSASRSSLRAIAGSAPRAARISAAISGGE